MRLGNRALLACLTSFLRGGRVECDNIDKVHINFIHDPTFIISASALGLVFAFSYW